MTRQREEIILRRAVARLRAAVMAVTFGATGGAALFLATAWLLLRGGENVGQHLGLLRNYLPGYSVTWGGAVLGLAYGVVLGGIAGASLAWTYNRIADLRGAATTRG
ncbi:MAG: hypothetical protein DWQ36_08905 [Acidobacteria bacterium]|nr:MAG: hypothetical protein DWQ36_08905 [Acidobacteriota bacterium]